MLEHIIHVVGDQRRFLEFGLEGRFLRLGEGFVIVVGRQALGDEVAPGDNRFLGGETRGAEAAGSQQGVEGRP